MEGEKKNNTAMLTVIAIATLLVAVIGATFAYFTATEDYANASVKVTATTAAPDIFQATGSANIGVTVNASDMQNPGDNAYSKFVSSPNSNNTLTISLAAGSGTATCRYNLVYTPAAADANANPKIDAYERSEFSTNGPYNEYTIQGGDGTQSIAEQNLVGTGSLTLNGNTKLSISTSSSTTQTWTFTAKFYNLNGDQNSLANKHFEGTVTVQDVECTNSAS